MDPTMRRIKACIYLISIGLIGTLYLLSAPFQSAFTEILLLFTSHSSVSVIGYLNASEFIKPAISVGLTVFQAVIAPFDYELLVFANTMVFGASYGLFLSLLGRMFGAVLCYDIGNTLFAPFVARLFRTLRTNAPEKLQKLQRSTLFLFVFRLFPLPFDWMSYVAGMVQLSFHKYLLFSFLWIAIPTAFYAYTGSYLPYRYELALTILRLVLSLGLLLLCCSGIKNSDTKRHPPAA